MKIRELLREEKEVPDYHDSMQALVGKEFDFEGTTHKITSVKWNKTYGQNYDIKVSPEFGETERFGRKSTVHPYGPGKKFVRMFSNWMGGLSVSFSEMGMQGRDKINVDVGPPAPARIPADGKEGVKRMAEFAASRDWEVLHRNADNVVISRKGKGKMMLAFIPATEDADEKFMVSKLQNWGYSGIEEGPTVDKLLKSMESGFMKKYFTMPKAKATE